MDQVRSDYISLKGFELWRVQVDSLRATAATQGLEAVVAQFPAELAAPADGEPAAAIAIQRDQAIGSRPPQGYPMPLGSADFCEAVMDAARRLDPRVPATDQPMDLRTVAHEVPAGLGVGIAQVVWFTPLTQERFRGFAGGGMFSTVIEEWETVLEPESVEAISMASLTAEELRARWHWVDREP